MDGTEANARGDYSGQGQWKLVLEENHVKNGVVEFSAAPDMAYMEFVLIHWSGCTRWEI